MVTIELPSDHRAPREARRAMEEQAAVLPDDLRHAAVLLVSELVSNSVSHGVGTVFLRIELTPDRLRVEVHDGGRGQPAMREVAGADGGWGLRLVDALATDWGAREDDGLVWFEIGAPEAERAPAGRFGTPKRRRPGSPMRSRR